MKHFQLIVFVSIFTVWSIEKTDLARFHRILKEYKNPNYSASDKDILGSCWYDSDISEIEPDEPDLTYGVSEKKRFWRSLQGEIGFVGKWIKTDSIKQISHDFDSRINGRLNENSDIENYQLWGKCDTNATKNTTATSITKYKIDLERHSKSQRFKGLPFWNMEFDLDLLGMDERIGKYQGKDDLSSESSKQVKKMALGKINLIPGIGLGKRKPILPVYQAFEFERALKSRGIIKRPFSDSIMIEIIKHCASMDAYTVKHERYLKYFMKTLESILLKDSSIDSNLLDAFTLFKLFETITTRLPDFFSGFSTSLNVNIESNINYKSSRYYGVERVNDSSSSGKINFHSRYWTFIEAEVTYPIFPRLFFEFSFMKAPSIPEPDSILMESRYLDNLYLYDMNIKGLFHYFITNRILMTCGVELNSNNKKEEINTLGNLDFIFFIEDHISINCNMRKSLRKYSEINQNVSFNRKDKREWITLGVVYDL